MGLLVNFLRSCSKLLVSYFTLTYIIITAITRLVLGLYSLYFEQINFSSLFSSFFVGAFNDLVSLSYIYPSLLLFSLIFLVIFRRNNFLGKLVRLFYFAVVFLLIFNLFAELIFWDEYGSRYNFIAVDYLVYTDEILGTLVESLPVGLIIFTILGLSILYYKIFFRQDVNNIDTSLLAKRFLVFTIIALLNFNFYDSKYSNLFVNRYTNQLSLNGLYELFSAFRNNSLNYKEFYTQIEDEQALAVVRNDLLKAENNHFSSDNDFSYKVSSKNLPKKHNVVIIVVESLSAEFLGSFGNLDNITPNLDEISKAGILFKNIYASGTRTVRGLEALTLSIPPTPGSSIIRRPGNDNIFNIGSVFRKYGYSNLFTYGGYSYFDNLKEYFSSNDYEILDRSDLNSNEISFANIWGVADEDIFNKNIARLDYLFSLKKPFFNIILTTSNHRPYNFPAGRIDLPSSGEGGRKAAVKYTDYAIGKFLKDASKKPWFDDTIFVIVADHCAQSAGKTELPPKIYQIPLIIYAPKILKPMVNENLASQIDIAPTIFGLLDFEYESKFFGHDLNRHNPKRAFIGTYQLLGYIKQNEDEKKLVIMSPRHYPKLYDLGQNLEPQLSGDQDENIIKEAMSFYQLAYLLFTNNKLKNFDDDR